MAQNNKNDLQGHSKSCILDYWCCLIGDMCFTTMQGRIQTLMGLDWNILRAATRRKIGIFV